MTEPSKQTRSEDWVSRLRSDAPDREEAITDLRQFLVRGLTNSLGMKYGGASFAEDVAQEALVRILNSLDAYTGKSQFTTWAMAIAMRVGISEFRRKHYQNVSLDLQDAEGLKLEIVDENTPQPARTMDQQKILQTLQALIATELSPKQRQAMMASLQEVPVEEIARRTNTNRNAVYKLIFDARKKLKQGFEKQGFSGPEILEIFS